MLEILINNYCDEDVSSFVLYVIYELQSYILDNMDPAQLQRIDDYLNSEESPYTHLLQQRKNIKLSAKNIIIGATRNLTYDSTGIKQYRIFVKPNVYIADTGISYASAIALLTNGNISLTPYTLFSDAMNKFDKDIPDLFEHYIGESI